MMFFLSILFLLFSAISKAIADSVAHYRADKLKAWFPKYAHLMNPNVKGKYFLFTKYPMDVWHIANSCFIFFILLSGLICPNGYIVLKFVTLGVLFNLVFNTFYNKIFK